MPPALPPEHPISFVQAIVLGIIQGLTEFLPVSSTAHMRIIPALIYGFDPGATFSAVCQLGPIVAIVAYFRNDLSKYWKGIMRTKSPSKIPTSDLDARLGWYTLVGTIPLCIAGVLLEHQIETRFRSLKIIAAGLIVLALILWLSEVVGRKNRKLSALTWKDAWTVGCAQVLALVPGASRSGVTITTGLFLGMDREAAARFSFLLSIPAISAAGIYKLFKAVKTTGFAGNTGPDIVAAVVAALVAYVIVNWFLKFMKEHSTMWFIVYRIALGVFILAMLKSGHLT